MVQRMKSNGLHQLGPFDWKSWESDGNNVTLTLSDWDVRLLRRVLVGINHPAGPYGGGLRCHLPEGCFDGTERFGSFDRIRLEDLRDRLTQTQTPPASKVSRRRAEGQTEVQS